MQKRERPAQALQQEETSRWEAEASQGCCGTVAATHLLPGTCFFPGWLQGEGVGQ